MINTNIQVVVFIFNLFKGTPLALHLIPNTPSLIRTNSNLTMFALTLSFVYKMLKKVYDQRRKKALKEYEHLP